MSKNDFESSITVFENEDLIFDYDSGKLLKISERIRLKLGGEFAEMIHNLKDYDQLTSAFSGQDFRKTHFISGDDQVFNYSFFWNSEELLIKDICWVNRERNTLHSIIYFGEGKNLFEVPYNSLVEIIEKMENPAILFDESLQKVLMINSSTIALMSQPISEMVKGFSPKDFFVYKNQFFQVANWLSDKHQSAQK